MSRSDEPNPRIENKFTLSATTWRPATRVPDAGNELVADLRAFLCLFAAHREHRVPRRSSLRLNVLIQVQHVARVVLPLHGRQTIEVRSVNGAYTVAFFLRHEVDVRSTRSVGL